MWELPRPGIEPVFPAVTGPFLTTGPQRSALESFKGQIIDYPYAYLSLVLFRMHVL